MTFVLIHLNLLKIQREKLFYKVRSYFVLLSKWWQFYLCAFVIHWMENLELQKIQIARQVKFKTFLVPVLLWRTIGIWQSKELTKIINYYNKNVNYVYARDRMFRILICMYILAISTWHAALLLSFAFIWAYW